MRFRSDQKIPGGSQSGWACDPFRFGDDEIEFTSNFNLQVSVV